MSWSGHQNAKFGEGVATRGRRSRTTDYGDTPDGGITAVVPIPGLRRTDPIAGRKSGPRMLIGIITGYNGGSYAVTLFSSSRKWARASSALS